MKRKSAGQDGPRFPLGPQKPQPTPRAYAPQRTHAPQRAQPAAPKPQRQPARAAAAAGRSLESFMLDRLPRARIERGDTPGAWDRLYASALEHGEVGVDSEGTQHTPPLLVQVRAALSERASEADGERHVQCWRRVTTRRTVPCSGM